MKKTLLLLLTVLAWPTLVAAQEITASRAVFRTTSACGTSITTGPQICAGSGSPEGAVTASQGSVYLRTNGQLWLKTTGSGNTGWTQTSTIATPVTVPNGGTGLASGTSGGILGFTASTTLASSAALTANLPVIGGGAGATPSSGTRTGNTTEFASWTGAKTSGACVEIDASGNLYAEASGCGVSGATIIPFHYQYVVGLCQDATATLGLNVPTSNAATAVCITGSNTQLAAGVFPDSATSAVQGNFWLPSDWTGNIDVQGKWRTSATTGNVVWQVSTICVADAETVDPAFNTASTTTEGAKGTTLQLNDFSMTTITITGCAAGEQLYWRFFRDASNGSDTLAADAQLLSLVFTIRRTI